jgi:hypothetical protein
MLFHLTKLTKLQEPKSNEFCNVSFHGQNSPLAGKIQWLTFNQKVVHVTTKNVASCELVGGRVASVKYDKHHAMQFVTHQYSGFFLHNAHIPNRVYFQLSEFWLIYALLATFATLRSMCWACPSICLYISKTLRIAGWILMKSDIWASYKELFINFNFSLDWIILTTTSHDDLYVYLQYI